MKKNIAEANNEANNKDKNDLVQEITGILENLNFRVIASNDNRNNEELENLYFDCLLENHGITTLQ